MRVWVYTISWNEARMMPFFLRHYSTFCDRIIVYDENSTDGTREIVSNCQQAVLRNWPYRGLDDDRFIEAVNGWYKEAVDQADWVIWADVDEFIYHPNPIGVLKSTTADIIKSIGYALINPSGFPAGDGQIYDIVKTGVRQENYDKFIVWRPGVDVVHTHGRHSPSGDWPKCSGVKDHNPRFKLFHCHHVGGLMDTIHRNQRNYDRSNDKRFAWNYSKDHNFNPNQNGSVAWVEKAIKNGLSNVI